MRDFLKVFIFVVLLLAIPYFVLAGRQSNSSSDFSVSIPFGAKHDYENILVAKVVDGDTLKLETGERVRLIGIDTPEMHDSEKLYRDSRKSGTNIEDIKALGRKAYAFTRNLVENKRVRLEFDVEKYDKYKRLLAYVYLKDDNAFVNAKIVEEGFASLLTIPPNVKYADLFLELYQGARENKRGLWK